MRMAMVGLTDIFLMLYLTSLTQFRPASTLTTEDYFALKRSNMKLQEQTDAMRRDFTEKFDEMIQEREEAEEREAEKQQQLEAALSAEMVAREQVLQEIAQTRSAHEQTRGEARVLAQQTEELQEKLRLNAAAAAEQRQVLAAQLERVQTEQQRKREALEAALQEREGELTAAAEQRQALDAQLTRLQAEQQRKREELEAALQERERELAAAVKKAQAMKASAEQARRASASAAAIADQARREAEQANMAKENALQLREAALNARQEAERQAAAALAAQQQAEANASRAEEQEKNALVAKNRAEALRRMVEKEAKALENNITTMKQSGETVYTKTVLPRLQDVQVSYLIQWPDRTTTRTRYDLRLLPINIDDKAVVFIPLAKLGMSKKSSTLPLRLTIQFAGQLVDLLYLNRELELAAMVLPGYNGETLQRIPASNEITDYMPILMAIRNEAYLGIGDTLRNLDREFYVFPRELLAFTAPDTLRMEREGFRGTGSHGERIVRGDQVVDLSGRFLGIANANEQISRINTLENWTTMSIPQAK